MYNNQNNQQNQFSCDLSMACDKFFETLEFVQVQQWGQGQIGRAYRDTYSDLKLLEQDLQSYAHDGLVEHISMNLDDYFIGYATLKALYQFLPEGAANGWTLSRKTPRLQEALKEKLELKHRRLTSQLTQILIAGKQARKAAQAKASDQADQARAQQVERSIKREYGRNQELYNLAMKAFNNLDSQARNEVSGAYQEVRNAYSDARKSLQVAMSAAERVMDPAARLTDSVSELIKTQNESLKQQQPSYQEELLVRANQRKQDAKLTWFLFIFGGIALLWVIGYLLIQHFPH